MTRRAENDVDATAVRRASRVVGLQITIASGALVIAAIGVAFFFVLDQLRPAELAEKPRPGEHKIYIDTTEAMVAFVVVGVLAVAVAGLASLIITRRAVEPLGRALRMQRTFVQDASHELRTPLAVLDARLQILQRALAADDPSSPIVAELRTDTRALIDIVNDLLLAAEPVQDAPAGPTRVLAAVGRAVDAMRVLAEPHGILVQVDSDTEQDPQVAMPAASLQRCITALVDNAIAHSPDGSTITVAVRVQGRTVLLTVTDQGGGIQGIDPRRIFDRFARAPRTATGDGGAASRSASSTRPSFGIGLALVRDLAARAGGSVDVAATGGDGTVLRLSLPSLPIRSGS
ncbi:sensor histidine kinase [Leifsonia sp. Root227]|uniref:sensor histidine kinase n=1 Tax=Leifsonia sp. Root227 TaxID=1736496 RepID=UPI000AAD4249|nr:HAMP domain-containing sensor histidine kinase [Leifsonia sp. Root227]